MGLSPCTLKALDMHIEKVKDRSKCISLGYPNMLVDQKPFVPYDVWAKRYGFKEWHSIDVSDFDGAEIIHDLNDPYETDETYNLAIDPGTMEHCFNISEVFRTLNKLCAVGGMIVHENPVNWVHHGYYNLTPQLFHDFYTQNGYDVWVYWFKMGAGETDINLCGHDFPEKIVQMDGRLNLATVALKVNGCVYRDPIPPKYKGVWK